MTSLRVDRTLGVVLRLDSGGGLLVGAFVLAVSPRLASLYALPLSWIHAMGAANVAYGCFSGTLVVLGARRGAVRRVLVFALAAANLGWAVACAGMLAAAWSSVGRLGVAHLGLEAAYVAGLAVIEVRLARRHRGRASATLRT